MNADTDRTAHHGLTGGETMHAHLLDAAAPLSDQPLHWRRVPRPAPGEGQLLIEVAASGVCRSNLHMIEGDWLDAGLPGKSPIVPGHEVTGRVAQIGAGVTGFAIGDAVGVQPIWWTCEVCEFCRSGREHLCHERTITGEHVDGGYGEYMLSYASHSYPLPEELDLVDAAPLFCPGITAYGAIDRLDIGPGSTVAVFGLGGVGHMAVQFAALTGATVIAVGRNRHHLQVALDLGAEEAIDSNDGDALDSIAERADAVVTFAPSDAVTQQALRTLKWGGTLVAGVPVTLSGFTFSKAQEIKTSILGNREQMREVLRLAAASSIRTVVDRFPMQDAARVLGLLSRGEIRSRAVLVNESASWRTQPSSEG